MVNNMSIFKRNTQYPRRNTNHIKQSFTLIELIVVIAIIAVLAAIIAPNVFKAIEKAKVANAVSTMKTIRSAAYNYMSDTGKLPCTKAGGWGKDPGFVKQITTPTCYPDELIVQGDDCVTPGVCIDMPGWDGPYLEKWPETSPWYKPTANPDRHGGMYDWSKVIPSANCNIAGMVILEIYGAVPDESLKRIDSVLDDGDLTQGNVHRVLFGTFDYLNYVAACY